MNVWNSAECDVYRVLELDASALISNGMKYFCFWNAGNKVKGTSKTFF